jgi:RNA polymerase sigma factor (sigma-70 family)
MSCVVQGDEGYNRQEMATASIRTASRAALPQRPKRLLALATDAKLVEHVRAGSDAAFEVVFERHSPAILGFCRHMLGSAQEAEDVVQHTFASAYGTLLRDGRSVVLKPWLFTIARNRSISVLRARREHLPDSYEVPTGGLSEQVEQRAELRELLGDLRDLPDEQRAALLLAELGGLSHAEVAQVIGCEVPRVKALVFRARSGLIERRTARDTSCAEIREQLANLRGGSLRRGELRHHLRVCSGCRDYREQVKRQRRLLAAALPVTPSLGLKSSVLSGLGLGGGSSGGGGALAGGIGTAAAPVGGTVAKVATVVVLAAGGAAAGERAFVQPPPAPAVSAPARVRPAAPAPVGTTPPAVAQPKPAPAARRDGAAPGHGREHGRGEARKKTKHHASGPGRSSHAKGAERRSARAPAAGPRPKPPRPASQARPRPSRPPAVRADTSKMPRVKRNAGSGKLPKTPGKPLPGT